jgi:hypothetical protein
LGQPTGAFFGQPKSISSLVPSGKVNHFKDRYISSVGIGTGSMVLLTTLDVDLDSDNTTKTVPAGDGAYVYISSNGYGTSEYDVGVKFFVNGTESTAVTCVSVTRTTSKSVRCDLNSSGALAPLLGSTLAVRISSGRDISGITPYLQIVPKPIVSASLNQVLPVNARRFTIEGDFFVDSTFPTIPGSLLPLRQVMQVQLSPFGTCEIDWSNRTHISCTVPDGSSLFQTGILYAKVTVQGVASHTSSAVGVAIATVESAPFLADGSGDDFGGPLRSLPQSARRLRIRGRWFGSDPSAVTVSAVVESTALACTPETIRTQDGGGQFLNCSFPNSPFAAATIGAPVAVTISRFGGLSDVVTIARISAPPVINSTSATIPIAQSTTSISIHGANFGDLADDVSVFLEIRDAKRRAVVASMGCNVTQFSSSGVVCEPDQELVFGLLYASLSVLGAPAAFQQIGVIYPAPELYPTPDQAIAVNVPSIFLAERTWILTRAETQCPLISKASLATLPD